VGGINYRIREGAIAPHSESRYVQRWIGWIWTRLGNMKNSAANISNQADHEIVVERVNNLNVPCRIETPACLKEITEYKIVTKLHLDSSHLYPGPRLAHASGHILYSLRHPCHTGSTTQNGSKDRISRMYLDEYPQLARGSMRRWARRMYSCCIPPNAAPRKSTKYEVVFLKRLCTKDERNSNSGPVTERQSG
jgi:hypothetical protein